MPRLAFVINTYNLIWLSYIKLAHLQMHTDSVNNYQSRRELFHVMEVAECG